MSDDIIVGMKGAAGIVTLTRPQALNALTADMRARMAESFPRWARDPTVYAVVIASNCERAFCAGGDLRELTGLGRSAPETARRITAEEYALNWLLECFTKPTVSLIDGIVIGSGVGITLYGTHRVAGERYRLSMPEARVGLVPDVGVAHAFARMPQAVGMYLALTGRAIGPADAYRLGLVTHCVPAARFGEIQAGLIDADPVDPLLDDRHADPGPGELEPWLPLISHCFSADTVEGIVSRLTAEEGAGAGWAKEVAADLLKSSPTSLKVTHRAVREAADLDLRQTLMQDYRLVCRMLEGPDLYEGVRALLVDRQGPPMWNPDRLEAVAAAAVERHFAELGPDELRLATRADMQAVRL